MTAVIDPSADLEEGVSLGENVIIGSNVHVGRRTVIGNGCVIHENTWVGAGTTIFDNAVLGRPPLGVASLTRSPRKELKPLRIGDGSVIGACAVLYRGTTIGTETLIGDLASVREECRIGSGVILARCVTVNYNTSIGNRVKIMDNSHITGNMMIEDDVFISVLVSTTNDNSMDRMNRSASPFEGPQIKKGASIGASAAILPGVIVGEYAVVTAGSVVTCNVPPRAVVQGSPARILKGVSVEWLASLSGLGKKLRSKKVSEKTH